METFKTFFDLIQSGGFIMTPLLLCSIVVWFVIFERIYRFWGLKRKLTSFHLEACNFLLRQDLPGLKRQCQKSQDLPTAHLILSTLDRISSTDPKISAHWRAAHQRDRSTLSLDLKGRLWVLATLATASPFIGLFGTVVGILRSFHEMSKSGSGGFAVVSAGISEALIATAAGILIAIISLLAFNAFQVQLSRWLGLIKIQMEEIFELWGDDHGPTS